MTCAIYVLAIVVGVLGILITLALFHSRIYMDVSEEEAFKTKRWEQKWDFNWLRDKIGQRELVELRLRRDVDSLLDFKKRLEKEMVNRSQPSNQVIRQHPQKECVTDYFGENCKGCGFNIECEKLIRKTDMHGNCVTLCDVINNRL